MSPNDVYQKLSSLPCHFTWELEQRSVGRTVEMNIENLEEHIDHTIQGTEVESYNLMGFYKTQEKSFAEARTYFNKALENTKEEDEKIVCLACLAWLTWKEESNSSSDQILEMCNQVQRILNERDANGIPEVMAEKAFSIANSGFTESGFQKALYCINSALEERPKKVALKLTKVFVVQKIHQVRNKHVDQQDPTVNEIKKLWEEIIEDLKVRSPDLNKIYGQALIHYALFLAKIKRNDRDASGKEYADKAEEVASSNPAVMRNVAKFYINTAGWQVPQLKKAVNILKEIASSRPDAAVYKENSLLGQVLLKVYKITANEEIFVEAKGYLRKSWNINKKYMTPAIDLCRLYQEEYVKTEEISALVKAEKILFQEMFAYYEELDETNKAHILTTYANLLKKYGPSLASFHKEKSSWPDGANEEIINGNLKEAKKLLHQYAVDRDDTKLHEAEKKFIEMYGNLEELQYRYQACFHREYGMFLEKYSKDLAFYHFMKSLGYNPHQRREYSYHPLEELANEKIAMADREEERKGREALEMMKRLQEN